MAWIMLYLSVGLSSSTPAGWLTDASTPHNGASDEDKR
jgi:hypothetical protein